MRELIKLSYVAERDIDLLLLEELNVNEQFASWFLHQASPSDSCATRCMGAWHSVTHPQLGESDLEVIYEDGFAVLVENKVDAPAQPDQAVRYIQRGLAGQQAGLWQSFLTCIVAPSRYIDMNAEAQIYDTQISYEKIRDWFKSRGDQRAEFSAYVLEQAIDQNRRGYSPIADDDVTQFWLSYWETASRDFPALEMSRPGAKPSNSDWPDFRPKALVKELNIVHKMASGSVDLQVRSYGDRLEEIGALVGDTNSEIVQAGKSAAIRMVVEPIDRFGSFEAQREAITNALEVATKLLQIGKHLQTVLR